MTWTDPMLDAVSMSEHGADPEAWFEASVIEAERQAHDYAADLRGPGRTYATLYTWHLRGSCQRPNPRRVPAHEAREIRRVLERIFGRTA